MSNQANNKRAAILARCSSEANVCDQVLHLKQYALGKYEIGEDDIYGDHIGGSSAIAERPQLKRLMQNIEEGKKEYAAVLAQDASRLGKTPEQVREITRWFAERNISLQFQQA